MVSQEENPQIIDVATNSAPFIEYIENLSGSLQGGHIGSENISASSENVRLCENFIKTTSFSTLYIVKENDGDKLQHRLVEELKSEGEYLSIIALIKSNEPISNSRPFDSQLHILNIPTVGQANSLPQVVRGDTDTVSDAIALVQDSSAVSSSRKFESIRSLINWGISPYFDLITSSEHSNDSIAMAKKKFNELSLTLQHLQQKIHTPDLLSSTHPLIVKMIQEQWEADDDIEKAINKVPPDILNDTTFLNQLTTIVNGWVKQIKSITKLNHSPSDGSSVVDEILFWKSMEESLNILNRQLSSREVTSSLEILKRAKRYHITIAFTNEIGLENKLIETNNNNSILKDLPLDELLTSDVPSLKASINGIFNHLKKLRNLQSYPLLRSIELVEVILKDITKKFIDLVSSQYVMSLPFEKFLKFYDDHISSIFQVIDMNVKSIINLIRELLRKRQEKFIIIRINQDCLLEWKDRLEYLKNFRMGHNNLVKTCETLDESDDKLIESYNQYIIPINACDMSAGGVNVWKSNENLYLKVYEDLKKSVISSINDLFNSCQNFNEFISIFEGLSNESESDDFILSFISEDHKLRCMSIVEGDVQLMLTNFRKYSSEMFTSLSAYTQHPVVNKVIWSTGIHKSASFYSEKLAQLFGENWDQYSIGNKISNEINSLLKSSNALDIVNEWTKSLQIEFDLESPIFKIVTSTRSTNKIDETKSGISLNFNFSNLQIVDQLHQLNNLGFKTPSNLLGQLNNINKVYPLTKDLAEHIDILNDILNDELTETEYGIKYGFLLENLKLEVLKDFEECSQITWSTVASALELQRIEHNDQDFSNLKESKSLLALKLFLEKIYSIYGKMAAIREFSNNFDRELNVLESCEYSEKNISQKLNGITELVNEFFYEDFGSTEYFYDVINSDIQEVLKLKCIRELNIFSESMTGTDFKVSLRTKFDVSLLFQDQTFSLSPSLGSCKKSWFDEINMIISTVSNNYLIHHSNNQKYISIFEKISSELSACYLSIDKVISKADTYLNRWKDIQKLWEVSPEEIEEEFCSEKNASTSPIELWIKKIIQIRLSSAVFDTTIAEEVISLNTLHINFSSVQLRIAAKYDDWLNLVLLRFSKILQTKMKEVDSSLVQIIEVLNQGIDFSLTSKIISAIVSTFNSKAQLEKDWRSSISNFIEGQTLLSASRFKLPTDWIFAEQLENHFIEVSTLTSKKSEYINEHLELIEPRLKNESKRIEEQIHSIKNSWVERKPISGELLPSNAIKLLHEFSDSCNKVVDDWNSFSAASSFLDLRYTFNPDMGNITEEIKDLLGVWLSLDGLWEDINTLRDQSWKSISPRALRRQLDEVLTKSRSLPSTTRQYSAFNTLQDTIKSHIRNHSIITELKGESMKPRHWTMLSKKFSSKGHKINGDFDFTLGSVWDLDLGVNEQLIKSILNQAAMEQTLEENLTEIKETWDSVSFDTFNYKNNRCRLIKGWDKLFDQCSVHLSSLSNMKNSAVYFNFEQEAIALERRISKLYILLDTWVDVQKEWVYLDGVFGNGESRAENSSEIAKLLPLEYSRFNNISHEFFAILRNTNKFPLVIDILTLPDIQKSMERILDSLNNVRRSLSDYLEKQRDLFPRFYFVGNEDLLQIIGDAGGSNGDITTSINQHIRKMFGGISSINYSSESSTIIGINGDLGEVIDLITPVSLIKFPRLHEWLKKLEVEIKFTLSSLTELALTKIRRLINIKEGEEELALFIDEFPNQIVNLAVQILFTETTTTSISKGELPGALEQVENLLRLSVKKITDKVTVLQRKKGENLIIELLHQRDVLIELIGEETLSKVDFKWNLQQHFYYDNSKDDPLSRLTVRQSQVEFNYGFEYLGVPDKLAYTPLTNRCFLSLTQALGQKLGGSPFGPAGTGKTESVKALGNNMGKMVIVFNCDDSFDFQSMGRIFSGLCKVGCWGCFDEFNRLDEHILSAVSSQIERIQLGLTADKEEIELTDKKLRVHKETGIFITMNPDYAGRSELPENLKKLFRSVSVEKPDMEVIVEVLLTSSGFSTAEELAKLIVPLFSDIIKGTSNQIHYDFGLRALKSTLVRCGNIKRTQGNSIENQITDTNLSENKIVYRSIKETIYPKLIIEDESVVNDLLVKYFPGISYESEDYYLINKLEDYAQKQGLMPSESWITKVLQLYRIQKSNHGIMLVGGSGTGKTTVWKSLLKVLTETNEESLTFVIDCKVIQKSEIYGSLDIVTREWVDGLLTSILRRITGNLRGELSKRIWIIFDGDIDPEWAENLNSVLDDNKILTLPNGERIALPENVKFIFEVDSLSSTTPATVSRCGMVWFDESLVPVDNLFWNLLHKFKNEKSSVSVSKSFDNTTENSKVNFSDHVASTLTSSILATIIDEAKNLSHVMNFNIHRYLETLFTLLSTYYTSYCSESYKEGFVENLKIYAIKSLILSLIWSFSGDCPIKERENFGKFIIELECFQEVDRITDIDANLIDYKISQPQANWSSWLLEVNEINLEPHQVSDSNSVVPTLDTARHEKLIYSMLNEHRPFLLCGPPGSGKTMILLEALRKSPDLDYVSLNFSKDTTPDLLMKSLHQFCEYKKVSSIGWTLVPKVSGKWVVVFCDEINLPGYDKYGTQRVISLLRQMIEHGGFWRSQDKQWVTLTNIQFVGACNPPTDPGRNRLSERFLRHTSLIMVDYPGKISLHQIYQTYNLAVMKCAVNLRGFTKSLTDAMIEVYFRTKGYLNSTMEQHYVYSPRELTRWSKGLLEGMKFHNYENLGDLVRLWYHEGLRLFYDRLVKDEDREWTLNLFQSVIVEFFPHIDVESCTRAPVLFSNWLSSDYEQVSESNLRSFISERLRVFSEEEIDVDLVLYDDMLDHVLRIDRVLRQPQGHMILVGPSTSGKSTLTRFVAWINGLKVIQLNVHAGYKLLDFDSTLRSILLRCAAGERICFMIDESSVLETSFIERMNTLLANAEIPGLFEDDNFVTLMKLCQSESQTHGLFLDSEDELYQWFTGQIATNLHVIFTISDTNVENRPKITTSPALFNRCVLSWMGDWSNETLFDVALHFIGVVPLDLSNYAIPSTFEKISKGEISSLRGVIVDTLIFIYRSSIHSLPSSFLQLVRTFIIIFTQKLSDLEENQRHINVGLDKLRETVLMVDELRTDLSKKKAILNEKDSEAKIMLNRMLTDQNEAERKQEFSIATQAELSKQQAEIERRRIKVMKDLELAEPAVLEAQRGVQNIKKQHLTEIRSMTNPPNAVKITMESVCILIGYDVNTWRDVQLIVRRDDFITNIVSFDNEEQLTPDLRSYMEKTYLTRSDFTFEAVNRASKACGPLLQWVLAQLTYSSILENVGPLREEMSELEKSTTKTKAQLIAIDQMISELEESIETYKDDYSQLIRDAENIKSDMRTVSNKVERSLHLIENLTSERKRWSVSTQKFNLERELLIGNCLLASSFTTYCGRYDERERDVLIELWKARLKDSGIKFDSILSLSNYLSSTKEISELQISNSSATVDSLQIENFAIMKRTNIPLIIDPPANVINTLSEWTRSSNKKLIVTSFLNSNYIQELENALRFGGTILIQDCEHYDPILNSVLRRETYKNGGRTVVKLKDQEIDFSPDFKLFLHTRDPAISLSQFVLGRTILINFTVTSSTLQNQILNITLKSKNPEIEMKRKELVLLQGTYKVRLFNLEKELLSSLSTENGKNILEDDEVVTTLESLKAESNQIDQKMKESSEVMEEVHEVRSKYLAVAKHSSMIFRILQITKDLNRFYNFALTSFMKIYETVLKQSINWSIHELVLSIYKETFAIVSPSFEMRDKVVLALCLLISYHEMEDGERYKRSILLILKAIQDVDSQYEPYFTEILKLNLIEDARDMTVDDICKEYPSNDTLKLLSDFLKCINVNENDALDRTLSSAYSISTSFLSTGKGAYSTRYDLSSIVSSMTEGAPIMLVSPDGFDPTFEVQQLASNSSINLSIISMGSNEGTVIANKEIEKVLARGSGWVIVQNVQLSGNDWLNQLEKKLQARGSQSFPNEVKIFLTCTTSSKSIPSSTLINKSSVVMFEDSQGIQARFMEVYKSIPTSIIANNPGERKHLYFLLIWFHCIILERLKYAPIAFATHYDITISDFKSGCFVIEKYLQPFGSTRTNISPDLIPWDSIRYMIAEITYGGKINKSEDLNYIVDLSRKLFTAESFNHDFNLIENEYTLKSGTILSPLEGITQSSQQDIESWVYEEIPTKIPLNWIDLEEKVDRLVREKESKIIASKVYDIAVNV
ncbi:dynein heavy chain, cytoplasmic [[Candida] railenensis]|uniref:Dynein heavy chain, cytoplasmic n=1 Tax=[Candida] railenensis TaxID=45579 RepID=A0A9P0QKN9_9ASCO|nr:dynein heavy chain, cytoplasmic [[Candida] railenensis]